MKAATPEERRKAAEKQPKPEPFAERCWKLAQERPNTREELFALCWAVMNAPASEPGKKALAILESGRLANCRSGRPPRGAASGADRPAIAALAPGRAGASACRGEPGTPGGRRTPHLGLQQLLGRRVARGAPHVRRGGQPHRRPVPRQPGHLQLLRVPGRAARKVPTLGHQVRAASPHDPGPGIAIVGSGARRCSRWRRS